MSSFEDNTTSWTTNEGNFELLYNLTYSHNHAFEDFELWEYGINCVLYDQNKRVVSTAEVQHISRDRSFVLSFLNKIVAYKVFPLHLKDVVTDYLDEISSL